MNDNLIKHIDEIEILCYTDRKEEGLHKIEELFSELALLNIGDNTYLSLLTLMMTALEKKDFVLLADYLEYGIKNVLLGFDIPEGILNEEIGTVLDINEKYYYLPTCTDELSLCAEKEKGNVIRLNSPISPEHEAEIAFAELHLKKYTPAVCLFGLGTGLLAKKILNAISEDSRLIIYEPNRDIIDYCLDAGKQNGCDVTEEKISNRLEEILNDDRVILCTEKEGGVYFRRVLDTFIDYTGLVGLVFVKHNRYLDFYPKEYLNFIRELDTFRLKLISNKDTIGFFKEEKLVNPLKNLCFLKNASLSSSLEKTIPSDIPAVVVAAGPSLDKNIDVLKTLKGHFLIFAVDSAVKYLLKKDIIPDLTITIDSRKPPENFSDERSVSIPCIFDLGANPIILNRHKGKRFLLDGQEGFAESILSSMGKNVSNRLGVGGSVATAAFAVLYRSGIKNIILVGQDLAYSGGVTHAGGDNDNSKHIKSYTEDIYGNQIMTRSDWMGYLKWFEDAIEGIQKAGLGIRVIDATEGGAKIHGTEIMTLQQVTDEFRDTDNRLPSFDYSEAISSSETIFHEDEYDEFCKLYRDSVRKLRSIGIEVEEAVRICDKLLKGMEEGTVSDNYIRKENKRLSAIREKYENSPFADIIGECADNDNLSDIARLELEEGDRKNTQKNMIKIMKLSFGNVASTIDKICHTANEFDHLLKDK